MDVALLSLQPAASGPRKKKDENIRVVPVEHYA